MMKFFLFCSLFLMLSSHSSCESNEDEDLDELFGIDRTGFVDPHGNSRRNQRGQAKDDRSTLHKCQEMLRKCKQKTALVQDRPGVVSKQNKDGIECSSDTASEEFIFLKRYVRQILKLFAFQDASSLYLHGQLSDVDRVTLENFVDGANRIPSSLDGILSSIFTHVAVPPSNDQKPAYSTLIQFVGMSDGSISTLFRDLCSFNVVFSAVLIALFTSLFVGILKRWNIYAFLIYFVTAGVLVSIIWHWRLGYLKVIAQRQSESMKLQDQLPVHCTPERMARLDHVITSFKRIFGSLDDCEKFHQAMLIDPIWEVSPMVALSDTIATFILYPFGAAGKYIGMFFKQIFALLPFTYAFGISLLLFVVLIIFILITCGYELNFPFWMGRIGPSYNPVPTVQGHQVGSSRDMVQVLESIAQRPPINLNITFGQAPQGNSTNIASLGNVLQQEDKGDSVRKLCIQYPEEVFSTIQEERTSVELDSVTSRRRQSEASPTSTKPTAVLRRCQSEMNERNDCIPSAPPSTEDTEAPGISEDVCSGSTDAVGNSSRSIHSHAYPEEREKVEYTVGFEKLEKGATATENDNFEDFEVIDKNIKDAISDHDSSQVTSVSNLNSSAVQELYRQFSDLVDIKVPASLNEDRKSLISTLKEIKDS